MNSVRPSTAETVEARFWERVDRDGPISTDPLSTVTTPCWLWTGVVLPHGYGTFSVQGRPNRRKGYGHRFSYELHVGPIPEGHRIDHLCRVRHCVNPDHLEAVTHQENCQRGLMALTDVERFFIGVGPHPTHGKAGLANAR